MVIGDFASAEPLFFMVIISLVVSIFITLINKYTTNQSEMKRLREELKSMQKGMKEHKDNHEKMMSIQKDLASKNLEYMKHSFKPMLYTFVPVILIFYWIRGLYDESQILLTLPLVGWELNWLWTYIVFSFIFSLIVRKIMKVH